MPKVSIIMPIYNSERYLKKAIECLLNQTLKDIEIILIDDGSTDSSSQICDEAAKKDKRIVVRHIKNSGICNARNLGMQIAKSDYIMFMDNDDEIDINTCQENYKIIKENNLDIVKFGTKYIFQYDNVVIKETTRNFEERILKYEDLEREKVHIFYNSVFSCVWDGIYRKEVLCNFDTFFKQGGEDTYLGLEMYPNLKSLMLRNKIYYYHYVRNGVSTSAKYHPNDIVDKEKIFKKYQELLYENGNLNAEEYNIMISRSFIYPILVNFTREDCNLNKRQKIESFKSLNFKFHPKSNFIKSFKLSAKYTMILTLYKMKMYLILLGIVRLKYDLDIFKKKINLRRK